MFKKERKVFEDVIDRIVSSTDIKEILEEFSKDRPLYISFLKDIAKGKDSSNYKLLKRVARNKKISDQFIIEQAKFILKFLHSDEPKEDYYKILNVHPSATIDQIRKSWLDLLKNKHPDVVGESGLEITKKLNEAYSVLKDPTKRIEYDTKLAPDIPQNIKTIWPQKASGILVYLLLIFTIGFSLVLYLTESTPLFQPEKEVGVNAERPDLTETDDIQTLTMIQTSPAKLDEPEGTIANPIRARFETVEPVQKDSKERSDNKEGAMTLKSELTSEMKNIYQESSESKSIGKKVEALLTGNEMTLNAKYDTNEKKFADKENTHEMEENTYVVKRGDNLWLIARRFNTRVKELKTINNLTSNRLDTGDVLLIPHTSTKESHVRTSAKEKTREGKENSPNKGSAKNISSRKIIAKQQLEDSSKSKATTEREFKVSKISHEEVQRGPKSNISTDEFSPDIAYPDKASLLSFVSSYVSAYKNRDIRRLETFFKQNARENGVEISKILPAYSKNFSSLQIMKYDIYVKGVELKDQVASINGNFELSFRSNSEDRVKSSKGSLNWVLSWQDNDWKIEELNYRINKKNLEAENL